MHQNDGALGLFLIVGIYMSIDIYMCVCGAYLENVYVYIYINIYITYVYIYCLYGITYMIHSHHIKRQLTRPRPVV